MSYFFIHPRFRQIIKQITKQQYILVSMAHRLQSIVMLHSKEDSSKSFYHTRGIPIEQLCNQDDVYLKNIYTNTYTTIATTSFNTSYYCFYVLSTNMDHQALMYKQRRQIKCIQNIRGPLRRLPWVCLECIARFLYPVPSVVCKLGIAKEPISRLKSYIVKFGRHTPGIPVFGVRLHFLIVQKKQNQNIAPYARPYSESAICKLEQLIKHRLRHNIDRGNEWVMMDIQTLCETVIGCMMPAQMQSVIQAKTPRKKLHRSISNSSRSSQESLSSVPQNNNTITKPTKAPIKMSSKNKTHQHQKVLYCLIKNVMGCAHRDMPKWNIGKVLSKTKNTIRIQWCNHHRRSHRLRSEGTFKPSWSLSIVGGYECFHVKKPKPSGNLTYIPTIYDFNTKQIQQCILMYFHMQTYFLPDEVKKCIVDTFGSSCA